MCVKREVFFQDTNEWYRIRFSILNLASVSVCFKLSCGVYWVWVLHLSYSQLRMEQTEHHLSYSFSACLERISRHTSILHVLKDRAVPTQSVVRSMDLQSVIVQKCFSNEANAACFQAYPTSANGQKTIPHQHPISTKQTNNYCPNS